MRELFNFWFECARLALRGNTSFANNWQWLFGAPIASGAAAYFVSQSGNSRLSTGYSILDSLLAATAAFLVTWLIAFAARLFYAPFAINRNQQAEINRLSLLAGVVRRSSFKVFIEEISAEDADRSLFETVYLFRVGVTNLDSEKTYEAHVILENVSPSLAISPAARLPAIGRTGDARTHLIAPSETVYFHLLERRGPRNSFLSDEPDFAPYVEFSVNTSQSAWDGVSTRLQRQESRVGELKIGTRYTATLATYAAGAISNHLSFSAEVMDDGSVHVESDTLS